MLSASMLLPCTVSADDLNQFEVTVSDERGLSDGSAGALPSITTAKISFPEIENYYPDPGTAYVIQKARLRVAASSSSTTKRTLNIGTKIHVLGYEGDWAKVEGGYIYAGLLSDEYTFKANIHGKNTNSLRYAGHLYKAICNLEGPLRSLAESTPITLVDSQKELCNETEGLGERTAGYTIHYIGTDRSEIRIWANTGTMQKDIIHELGHVFDFSKEGSEGSIISDDKEWKQIFSEEKKEYFHKISSNEHYILNQQEYFASSIQSYITEPKELKEAAPKTYAYIHALLS